MARLLLALKKNQAEGKSSQLKEYSEKLMFFLPSSMKVLLITNSKKNNKDKSDAYAIVSFAWYR